ncbi:glycoside hydrolase family 43 protein [Rufibacter radiotolerans]|uniref:glycoside hydrolase family 43 protein n=1 Tax=Rufibacter radiotolerans TaxID=1379910 RepID=UPI001E35290C|nr:glycoside hydrolase family 43 protein [Rufibacter radiotolerans]
MNFTGTRVQSFLRLSLCAALLQTVAMGCQTTQAPQPSAPAAQATPIALADPTMFFHDGTYYLYGTGNPQGFQVYTSQDMKTWKGPTGNSDGFALKKGDAFGSSKFWAPQVFLYNGKFHMAYVADEGIAIATSDSPLGPFSQTDKKALAAPVKQIDPFLFIDDDGKKYMYHVRVADGGNRMFVAEMSDDLSAMKMETLKQCIEATEPWENTEKDAWSVTEGPTILKHKGTYYFIYSANHFKWPSYAVGYATSNSPYGPWEKYTGNPIISKANLNYNGTGHGDVVKDQKGNMFYVMHTHQSATQINPRKTGVVKMIFSKDPKGGADILSVDPKTFHFLEATQ